MLAKVIWLTDNEPGSIEYDERGRVGHGAQAEVFPVTKVVPDTMVSGASSPEPLLAKIFYARDPRRGGDPYRREHVLAFLNHLVSHRLNEDGLQGLPRRAFAFAGDPDRVGYLMRRVPGSDTDDEAFIRWVATTSLPQRLRLVAQLAASVARLHTARVVHADISDSNVVADRTGCCLYLIDADGGGVLEKEQAMGFTAGLFPLVRGHANTMAPQLLRDDSRHPGLEDDDWSLAMLVHRFLLPHGKHGISPFFFLTAADQLSSRSVRWPPREEDHPTLRRRIDDYNVWRERLGWRVNALFGATFGQGRLDAPQTRTTAASWASALSMMAEWVYVCPCGVDYVAHMRDTCMAPNCQWRRVAHAQIETPLGKPRILTEPLDLLSDQLGFTDGQYTVARITRKGRSIIVQPVLDQVPRANAAPARCDHCSKCHTRVRRSWTTCPYCGTPLAPATDTIPSGSQQSPVVDPQIVGPGKAVVTLKSRTGIEGRIQIGNELGGRFRD